MRDTHPTGLWMSLVVLALVFTLMTIRIAPADQPSKAVQYHTVTLPFSPPPSLLQSKLDEYGREAWELVVVIPQSGTFIFKRA